MDKLLNILKANQAFQALLAKNKNLVVNHIQDEALLISCAFLSLNQDIVIIKENQYEANLLYQQVSKLIKETVYYPVDESYRIESLAASPQLLSQRINALYQLSNKGHHLLISHVHGLMRYVPSKNILKQYCKKIKVGQTLDIYELQQFLIQAGYQRTNRVDQMCFLINMIYQSE